MFHSSLKSRPTALGFHAKIFFTQKLHSMSLQISYHYMREHTERKHWFGIGFTLDAPLDIPSSFFLAWNRPYENTGFCHLRRWVFAIEGGQCGIHKDALETPLLILSPAVRSQRSHDAATLFSPACAFAKHHSVPQSKSSPSRLPRGLQSAASPLCLVLLFRAE